MAKATTLLEVIERLIKAGYPEGTAKKIATGELPMDSASRSARAKTQGYVNPQYHASMQDLIELEPGYNDGLIFTTPSSKFANEWLGKGKHQTRIGEPDAYERTKKQSDAIYKELGSPDYPSPEYDEFLARTDPIRLQERDAFKTIYPLLTRNEKTFDPGKNIKELEGLFSKERLDSPYSADYPTFRDALKSGNYLLYENKEMVDYLKSKGYDSMLLRESTYSKEARNAPYTTLAHFNPSQIRSRSAAFDPENVSKPNILGSAAPVAAGGILAALGGNDAQSSEYRPTDKSVADLAQRTIRQSYDPLPSVGSIEGVPNNLVSQGANTAAFKMDRLNRNLQNAGILSLLAPESTPDVLGRAAYGESRWYDPALVLLDFL